MKHITRFLVGVLIFPVHISILFAMGVLYLASVPIFLVYLSLEGSRNTRKHYELGCKFWAYQCFVVAQVSNGCYHRGRSGVISMLEKSEKQSIKDLLRHWYTEGLTGELSPDYEKIEKKRKQDLERLQRSIREA